ncbi:DUF2721 domain-containing protein [Anatilimnocola aggregata]|nr:DUF2721 domain-containing protein [Anatilimnocola aggregata]
MPNINAIEILAAMISPAVLMAAAGSVVLSTSNRLGRVVDRTRGLLQDAQRLDKLTGQEETPAEKAQHDFILEQLDYLSQRMYLLRSALAGLYTSMSLLVMTSLLIGVLILFRGDAGWIPLLTGFTGAIAFLFSVLQLLREATLAVLSTQVEMRFIKQLLAKRKSRL